MTNGITVSDGVESKETGDVEFKVSIKMSEFRGYQQEKILDAVAPVFIERLITQYDHYIMENIRNKLAERVAETMSAEFVTKVINKMDIDAVAKVATIFLGKSLGKETWKER